MKLMAEREDLKFVTDIKPDADEEFKKFEGRYFSTPRRWVLRLLKQIRMLVLLQQSRLMLSLQPVTQSSK